MPAPWAKVVCTAGRCGIAEAGWSQGRGGGRGQGGGGVWGWGPVGTLLAAADSVVSTSSSDLLPEYNFCMHGHTIGIHQVAASCKISHLMVFP